jgi:hypothetical protein
MLCPHFGRRALSFESLESRSLLAGDLLEGAAECAISGRVVATSDIMAEIAVAVEIPSSPQAATPPIAETPGAAAEEVLADDVAIAALVTPEAELASTEAVPLEETVTVGPPVLVNEDPDFLGSPWLSPSRRPLAVNPSAIPLASAQDGDAATTDDGAGELTSGLETKWRLAR